MEDKKGKLRSRNTQKTKKKDFGLDDHKKLLPERKKIGKYDSIFPYFYGQKERANPIKRILAVIWDFILVGLIIATANYLLFNLLFSMFTINITFSTVMGLILSFLSYGLTLYASKSDSKTVEGIGAYKDVEGAITSFSNAFSCSFISKFNFFESIQLGSNEKPQKQIVMDYSKEIAELLKALIYSMKWSLREGVNPQYLPVSMEMYQKIIEKYEARELGSNQKETVSAITSMILERLNYLLYKGILTDDVYKDLVSHLNSWMGQYGHATKYAIIKYPFNLRFIHTLLMWVYVILLAPVLIPTFGSVISTSIPFWNNMVGYPFYILSVFVILYYGEGTTASQSPLTYSDPSPHAPTPNTGTITRNMAHLVDKDMNNLFYAYGFRMNKKGQLENL